MNNQKQQALEALEMLDVHTGKDSKSDYWCKCFEYVKQFIESIPDTLKTSCRCDELQSIESEFSIYRRRHQKDTGRLQERLTEYAGLIDKLQSQLESERAAHAKTKHEIEQLGDDYRMQRRELLKEQSAHAETRDKLEFAEQTIAHLQSQVGFKIGDSPIDTEPDDLPTKAELLAEMQRVADYVNGKHPHVDDFVTLEKDKIHDGYWFMVDGDMIGSLHCYKPEPVAPADGEPVFAYDGTRWFSRGKFDNGGRLFVEAGSQCTYLENWCSINDRNNHSPGWKREWEPDHIKPQSNHK